MYSLKRFPHKYIAYVPKEITKTNKHYYWLLPHDLDEFAEYIKKKMKRGYSSATKLCQSLRKYFTYQVTKEAKLPNIDEQGYSQTLRTIRCTIATNFVKTLAEYQVMGWKLTPPNPLQHESVRTTFRHYASRENNTELDA